MCEWYSIQLYFTKLGAAIKCKKIPGNLITVAYCTVYTFFNLCVSYLQCEQRKKINVIILPTWSVLFNHAFKEVIMANQLPVLLLLITSQDSNLIHPKARSNLTIYTKSMSSITEFHKTLWLTITATKRMRRRAIASICNLVVGHQMIKDVPLDQLLECGKRYNETRIQI